MQYQKSTDYDVIPLGMMHSIFATHLPEKIWFSEIIQYRGRNSGRCTGGRSLISAVE